MQRNVIYILIILSVLLNGCRKPLNPILQKAEVLMEKHPDSALKLLEKYHSGSFNDAANRALYALLRTQADDKNYINHSSDSLIKIAVQYYNLNGSDLQKAKAHYYWGRVFQDRNDDVHTAEQFLIASSLAEKSGDINFINTIKSNLGYLLWNQQLYDWADSIYKQLIPIEKKLGDTVGLSICFLKIGEISMQLKNPNYLLAEKYLKISQMYSTYSNNLYIRHNILCTLALLYVDMNTTDKAIYYAKSSLKISQDSDQIYNSYFAMGSAYAISNKNDSAFIFLYKSVLSHDNNIKKQTYQELASIYRKKGEKDRYIHVNDKYIQYKDSSELEKQPGNVVLSIKNIMSNQLEKKHHNNNIIIYYTFISLFCILILVFAAIYYKKKSKWQLNKKKNEINEDQINMIIDDIVNSKIKKLTAPSLRKQMMAENIYLKLLEIRDYNSTISEKIEKVRIKSSEWDELQKSIQRYLPDVFTTLNFNYCQLNEKDIRFLCLIRLEFTYREIALILALTPQAIDYRREVLRKKMGCDSEESLKQSIFSL